MSTKIISSLPLKFQTLKLMAKMAVQEKLQDQENLESQVIQRPSEWIY